MKNDLVCRLRDAAEMMQRGVYSPGHIAVVTEAADFIEKLSGERMDCIMCGGKGTLVGNRSKFNGHFHGECEACGARIME